MFLCGSTTSKGNFSFLYRYNEANTYFGNTIFTIITVEISKVIPPGEARIGFLCPESSLAKFVVVSPAYHCAATPAQRKIVVFRAGGLGAAFLDIIWLQYQSDLGLVLTSSPPPHHTHPMAA